MISVVVSTYQPELFEKFKENLAQTIGIDYELVAIENNAEYSICEAYNLGVEKSTSPYICFIHEDILFKTNDWGKRLVSLMEADTSIGLIGVAGSKFKSTYPLSGWGQGPSLKKYKKGHIYTKFKGEAEAYLNFDEKSSENEIEEVVCLDGIFLFAKKDVFETCHFDEKMLTNFHGYDVDISLQAFFQNYRVMVDRKIEVIHFSRGNYSPEFTDANKKIWKKWVSKLPVATSDLNMSKFQLYKTDAINWYYSGIDTVKRKLHIQ